SRRERQGPAAVSAHAWPRRLGGGATRRRNFAQRLADGRSRSEDRVRYTGRGALRSRVGAARRHAVDAFGRRRSRMMKPVGREATLLAFDYGEKRIGVAVGNALTRQ